MATFPTPGVFVPVDQLLEAVRRPEYVGADRCWPCTVVNAALATLVAAVISQRSRPLGLLALAAGTALLALRGYVVPGTPRFTPRLVARLPLDALDVRGSHRTSAHGAGSVALAHDAVGDATADRDDCTVGEQDPEAILTALVEAGVVVPGGEDLHLDDEFRAAWTDRIAELREIAGPALAERVAAASYADIEGSHHGGRVLLVGGRDVWVRRAVAVAETAAVETLERWGVPGPVRTAAADPLRTFLRTCPACGSDVHETTLSRCCGGPGGIYGSPEQQVLACEACSTVIFEFEEVGESGSA